VIMFGTDESGTWVSGAEISATEGVYRDAFPAYRVFIYYHEVTADVTEIRVNQAGGSAERSAGGVSLTLLNPADRYILTRSDMAIIGAQAARINDRAYKVVLDAGYDVWRISSMMFEELQALASTGNIDALYTYIQSVGLKPEDFITNDADGNPMIADRETLVASVLDAGSQVAGGLPVWPYHSSYTGDVALGGVKRSVLESKFTRRSELFYDKNSSLLTYEPKTVFDFPFQEGDCIFYPNDPVRIAWRDPFDARVWYWAFSGFIDAWTENAGTNKDSSITINCTDVTKMARYSYSQINTGLFDDLIFKKDATSQDTKNQNFILYFKELFKGFTIPEVLETLFFGVGSAISNIDIRTRFFVAKMSNDAAVQYIYDNFQGSTLAGLDQMVGKVKNNHDVNLQITLRQSIYNNKMLTVLDTLNQYDDLGIIKHPGGVSFRRKNDKHGVYVYYLGTPDIIDAQIGEEVPDLKTWNDIIHHRVQRSDLQTMAHDGKGATIPQDIQYNKAGSVMDVVITTIGTNVSGLYPVGCGRVFYFTSPRLQKWLGTNAIDNAMGGTGSMHSEFLDDLTLLYDLAENIEYCFYATPKGDVVFEMPFYDFDTIHFGDPKDLMDHNYDMFESLHDYESLFRDSYGGLYTDAELQELTNMTFKLQTTGTNYRVPDYTQDPVFNYLEQFAIESHETYSYSNSCSDSGVCTIARQSPKLIKGNSAFEGLDRRYAYVFQNELIPSLGIRLIQGGMLNFIDDYDTAQLYLAVFLNRVNAEAHNLSIPTIPKFGLMVNRPIRWKKRNYSACIASLQHSIVWNSSCDTTINMNQVRGWTGEVDTKTGQPLMKHFGGDRPFDIAKIVMGGSTGVKDKLEETAENDPMFWKKD